MTRIKSLLASLLRLLGVGRRSRVRSPGGPSSEPRLRAKPVRPVRMNPPR